MCTGSLPWPYITAGILLSRRILRAAPLPNWVRVSATSLLSDTCAPGESKSDEAVGPRRGTWHRTTGARTARGSTGSASASVDHGCVDRITRSDRTPLAGATSLAEATPRV